MAEGVAIAARRGQTRLEFAGDIVAHTLHELVASQRGQAGGVDGGLRVRVQPTAIAPNGPLALTHAPSELERKINQAGSSSLALLEALGVRQQPEGAAGGVAQAFSLATIAHQALSRAELRRGRLVWLIHVTAASEVHSSSPQQVAQGRSAATNFAADVRATGNELLVTQVYLPSGREPAVAFPTEEQAAQFDRRGRYLFEMSSPVPAELMAHAEAANPAIRSGTGPRMMFVNQQPTGIREVLGAPSAPPVPMHIAGERP